jgi:hypothetical protein
MELSAVFKDCCFNILTLPEYFSYKDIAEYSHFVTYGEKWLTPPSLFLLKVAVYSHCARSCNDNFNKCTDNERI